MTLDDKYSILKKYWGYSSFRPLQPDIIDAVLQKKDCLALLPTGGGKSICFQVPAMLMEGICLVISPLIALMKDQVENLDKKGIPALAVHAGMNYPEVKKTLQNAAFGNYKFLYLSPERLETSLFQEFLPAIKPSLIAVDEAHCISQWGYDFRPPYLRINNIRKHLPGVPLIALTASATPLVQEDICEKLGFGKNGLVFRQSFERPNLSYSVFSPESKESRLLEIIKKVKGSSIVYCKSRKHTRQVNDLLNLHGISSSFYHAGLSHAERTERQQQWINNAVNTMVCTNAFGMGIDKPDVRLIVHYDITDCLENYYQEAGRAGRDGKKAYAVLLYEAEELETALNQLPLKYPDAGAVKTMYNHLMNYLQVPAGSGEMQTYDMDIAAFSQRFKLNILGAGYGLQALSMAGLVSYAELNFKPSTVEFICTKEDLRDAETMYPETIETIKGLLRSYEGIFDYPCSIYETLLSSFLKKPVEHIKNELQRLHQLKIITYSPASENPQVTLLLNRMYMDDYKIDQDNLMKRRKKAIERLHKIQDFARDTKTCRSRIIGLYFGDKQIMNCGVCDNCLHHKREKITAAEVKQISNDIIEKLALSSFIPLSKFREMTHFKFEKISQVLDYLMEEDIIGYNHKEEIYLSKKKGTKIEI